MATTKPNPTPHAPFNLRVTGPMKPADIVLRLGKGFRIAQGHGDQRATVDAEPCPHCGMPVEWAPTTKMENGKQSQYVYGRCQGKQRHSWGFTQPQPKVTVSEIPAPRPSGGAVAMAQWIDKKRAELENQLKALQELRNGLLVFGVNGQDTEQTEDQARQSTRRLE